MSTTTAGKLSPAERLDQLNTETAKLHAWIRVQANAPAQKTKMTMTTKTTAFLFISERRFPLVTG